MQHRRLLGIIAFVLVLCVAATSAAVADVTIPTLADGPHDTRTARASHRLIVELDSPALVVAQEGEVEAAGLDGALDINSSSAQNYLSQLQAEQQAFVAEMQSALSGASVSTFINEFGAEEPLTYRVVFNGMAIDPGNVDRETAKARLERMDGVKAVYYDNVYETQLYTSTSLINAPVAWNSAPINGVENAGAGIKFASVDGGAHKDAAMFDGTGYAYPDGYGPNGLGLTENNNGKIIVSRTYFRSWDPPAAGDENPWPGENGTSHGTHTASTAAGNCVDNVTYAGYEIGAMCGVAPKAYVMSYRVFYPSVNGNDSSYTAEMVAALEDMVVDGADVVQNSWGEGQISEGGAFDPIDTALINASKAGVFVSMSAGNQGPGKGTGDHPSPDYINVAASSTGGSIAAGRLGIADDSNLGGIAFAQASFGGDLPPLGQSADYDYLPSAAADPANILGCDPWPSGAFDGKAAMIKRGSCEFGVKVLNAQQAGAVFAVIYNDEARGDELVGMSGGAVGDQVTIASIFIGNTGGTDLVAFYSDNGAAASILRLDMTGFQAGDTADRIVAFSSRGPGVGNTLKPDIAAPGANIMAQGYAVGVTGEARHLGYGQVGGTSMAGPHVAGAGILLRQAHPEWSPADVKSALMSTAKYMEIYNFDGSPAQPLDMGAGRLDVGAAMDPGVLLDPPSIGYGLVLSGTAETINVAVTNVSDAAETYSLSTLDTGKGFTETMPLTGFSVNPASVSLAPGETKNVAVTFDGVGTGIGDNQGYILMDGDNGHKAHMPAWGRVTHSEPLADILIIDNDFSANLQPYDYLWYYTSTLDELGYSYNVVDVEDSIGEPTSIPETATLLAYKAIIWYTGDHYEPDGTYGISTGLTQLDQDRLVEYLNDGGTLIAMGQDLAASLGADETDPGPGDYFLYVYRFGSNWIQDSVTDNNPPDQFIVAAGEAPSAFADIVVDLTFYRKYDGLGTLSGANETPPVDTATTGETLFEYDVDQNLFEFAVTVIPTTSTPIEVTGAHIHFGAAGINGPVVRSLDIDGMLPLVVTDTLTLAGVISDFTSEEQEQMASGEFYINVHTTANPSGEVREQLLPQGVPHHLYVDEMDNVFHDGRQDPNDDGSTSESNLASTHLLQYQGADNIYNGTVALAHRDQRSLERPGTDYSGRSIYTSFGLEGMNSGTVNPSLGYTPTTRAELIQAFLDWGWGESSAVTIKDTTQANSSGLTTFEASLGTMLNAVSVEHANEAVSYRWDFGDGSAFVTSASATVGHTYVCAEDSQKTFAVRVEIVDDMGIVSLGSLEVDVSESCLRPTAIMDIDEPEAVDQRVFMPFVIR